MSRSLIIGAFIAAIGIGGWLWYGTQGDDVPGGFVRANGRIEATRVDVATRYGGRLEEVLVGEGDFVEARTVIARIDSSQLDAQLREADATVEQARQSLVEAEALLAQRKSELVFAEQQLARAESLSERGFETGETVDLRRSEMQTATAAVRSAEAGIARAKATIAAAQSTVDRLKADLKEYVLLAPGAGRVQYRLAEPGEVLAAGAKVVTMLDISDVYMTVYLPTDDAGRLEYGSEARIVFDAAPEYVVPASVTFVASEAQFTPKYVETEQEREKLMFRVEVTIPPELLEQHRDIVKTGLPGVAYLRLEPDAEWPEDLAPRLPDVH